MSGSFINLCSSPELKNESFPKSSTRDLCSINNHPDKSFCPLSDWIGIISDNSDNGDLGLHHTHLEDENLLSKHPIAERQIFTGGISNDHIDLVSDESDGIITENLSTPINKPETDENENIELNVVTECFNPIDLTNSIETGRTKNLSYSELSDPFVSSSPRHQPIPNLPNNYCSKIFSSSTEKCPDKLSTKLQENLNEVEEISHKLTKDQIIINLTNSSLTSLSSLLNEPEDVRDISKRNSNTEISSDEDIDEAWVRELIKSSGEKEGKTRALGQKNITDKRLQKNIDAVNENILDNQSIHSGLISQLDDRSLISASAMEYTELEKAKEKQRRVEQKKEIEKFRGAEKLRKIKEREENSRKKAKATALSRLNKLKSRLESTSEMIVDLPSSMSEELVFQVKTLLNKSLVECNVYQNMNNIIKWRRKVQAEWDLLEGHWKPVDERIQDEEHVMYVIKSNDLVELINGIEGHDLNAFILKIVNEFSGRKIIFLIEGLNRWFSKSNAFRNKNFTNSVRKNILENRESSTPTATRRQSLKKKLKQSEYIEKSLVEDALLRLHVVHNMLIHHTETQSETAEWIMRFTQHISTIPYRHQFETTNTANFCTKAGQIDSGKDAKDTYVQMLQQLNMLTPPVAWGIKFKYKNFQSLIRGLEENGPLALEHCRKTANKNGSFADTHIGKTISRRVHSFFLSKDAWSTDI